MNSLNQYDDSNFGNKKHHLKSSHPSTEKRERKKNIFFLFFATERKEREKKNSKISFLCDDYLSKRKEKKEKAWKGMKKSKIWFYTATDADAVS